MAVYGYRYRPYGDDIVVFGTVASHETRSIRSVIKKNPTLRDNIGGRRPRARFRVEPTADAEIRETTEKGDDATVVNSNVIVKNEIDNRLQRQSENELGFRNGRFLQ